MPGNSTPKKGAFDWCRDVEDAHHKEPKEPMVLEGWSVTADPYSAPECPRFRIVGKRPDGLTMMTSAIVRSDGLDVFTESGSHYRLGRVSPDYARWRRQIGKPINPRQPLPRGGGGDA